MDCVSRGDTIILKDISNTIYAYLYDLFNKNFK